MLFRIKSLSFLAVILNICVSAFGSPTASITSSSSCRVPAICGDGYSAQWQEIELGSAKVGPPAGPRRGLVSTCCPLSDLETQLFCTVDIRDAKVS